MAGMEGPTSYATASIALSFVFYYENWIYHARSHIEESFVKMLTDSTKAIKV
jgi:hypothetical protein